MKKKLLFRFTLFVLLCIPPGLAPGQSPVRTANDYVKPYGESFLYGSNLGYFGSAWPDEKLGQAVQKAGGNSLRITLPEHFIERWGVNIRVSAVNYYANSLGVKDLVCFVEGPSDAHRDKTVYAGNREPSRLFANLYQPIWKADGTVNPNNYYAHYIYRLVTVYGNHIRFWEVVNEPDYVSGARPANWLTRAPLPNETVKTLAPFYHYVRMLRITWEVVKKYNPDDYVTTGGIGHKEYLDALLRYTDNPAGGAVTAQYPHKGGAYFDVVSYHVYPSWFLRRWENGGFKHLGTSDYAAAQVITHKKDMEAVLLKYGYNGTAYPRKHFIVTETNVSRRPSDWRHGSDEMQRNFGMKALVLAQKNNLRQLHIFGIAENADAPAPGAQVSNGASYGLMGLYENLNRDKPGSEKLNQLGKGYKTTAKLLAGYQYSAARTEALQLPDGVEGAAFTRNGTYLYVLWAKTLRDKSERASATYSFPKDLNIAGVERHEWDHAVTGKTTREPAQSIDLSGSPAFFEPYAGTVATPAPPKPEPKPDPTPEPDPDPKPTPAPVPAPPPTAGNGTPPAPVPATCPGTGFIVWEQWEGVPGVRLPKIPAGKLPSETRQLTQFEAGTDIGDNYIGRIRGYVCPPKTGRYTFYVAGDDHCELWLSTSSNPADRKKIAIVPGWTKPRQWTKYNAQESREVYLTAGMKYYVEALQKEAWGGDNLAVGWIVPGTQSIAVIPGAHLVPYAVTVPVARQDTPSPETVSTGEGQLAVYPNPFTDRASVQFRPSTDGEAKLELYDLQGNLVKTLFAGKASAGRVQRFDLEAARLKSNVYMIRLVSGTGVWIRKITLVR